MSGCVRTLLNPCKSTYKVNDVSPQNVLPVLKWVRGEPLSQEHWLELFRLIKMPRNMTLEKLTFGDLLTSADHIAANAEVLKVCLKTFPLCSYIRENVHQVGSILFQANLIITQLAMFYLLLCFDHHRRPEEGRRWWSKRRSKLNIASCVIMKFVWNTLCSCYTTVQKQTLTSHSVVIYLFPCDSVLLFTSV